MGIGNKHECSIDISKVGDEVSVKTSNDMSYLVDLKSRDGMHLYYGCKLRHGKVLSDRNAFIGYVTNEIKAFVAQFDFVVYPESSSDFLARVVSELGKPAVVVMKNGPEYMLSLHDGMNLQKGERASHVSRISEMGNAFKINALKASQRDKYEPHLFMSTQVPVGRGLIIDDSCFSGTTLRAMRLASGVQDFLAIFSK